jgi:hypothetical protein
VTSETSQHPEPVPEPPDTLEIVGQEFRQIVPFSKLVEEGFGVFGGMIVMFVRATRRALTPPFVLGDSAYQVEMLGTRSL